MKKIPIILLAVVSIAVLIFLNLLADTDAGHRLRREIRRQILKGVKTRSPAPDLIAQVLAGMEKYAEWRPH